MTHLLLGAAALALGGCTFGVAHEPVLRGETMGSEWTVRITGKLPAPASVLQDGVQAQFDAADQALSTWRPDSALSRFNEDDSGQWVDIDPELAAVMSYGLSLGGASEGAYDLTIGPLVNLWGFGPDPTRAAAPEAAAIDAARARVGWRRVEVDLAGHRARKAPGIRIDLSSLGKGRGVDRVADYLDAQGVANYLIDLSGKLRAHGVNSSRQPWRVAVEQPGADDPSGAARTVPAAVSLRDASIATSGDYRKYFESGGRHFSHIIDPRTGWPVTHGTLSATAIARTCMQADALATVFMVMAPDAALRLADAYGTPGLWISRADGEFQLARSASWPRE